MMNIDPDKQVKLEWARLQVQTIADDIRFSKRQQWATTNYVIIIFAALIGLSRANPFGCSWISDYWSAIVIMLATIASIIGIYHLLNGHRVGVLNRNYEHKILIDYDGIIIERNHSDIDNLSWGYHFRSFTLVFISILFVGVFVVSTIACPKHAYPAYIAMAFVIGASVCMSRSIKRDTERRISKLFQGNSSSKPLISGLRDCIKDVWRQWRASRRLKKAN